MRRRRHGSRCYGGDMTHQFELPLELRRTLWTAGFAGIDCAMRHAAVELDIYLIAHVMDMECDTDEADRHFTNFLAWTDTVLVGIDAAIRSTGDHELRTQWARLSDDPVRALMRECRNFGLKRRREVIGVEVIADMGADGYLLAPAFQVGLNKGEWFDMPVLGTGSDYWNWIKTDAIPLLLAAIEKGCTRQDDRTETEMPFAQYPEWVPWLSPVLSVLTSNS